MKRTLERELVQWLRSPSRLLLILKGARQVGKAFLIRDFAGRHAPSFCEFNFEEDRDLASVFEGRLDPGRIADELALRARRPIREDDLLFFDISHGISTV